MSETFTPRCSFGTTRRFRISPASYVDLTQTFSRRGFPSLPCLRRCVKYLTNVQSPKDKGRELQISSQFDSIFSTATRAFVCKVRLSIDKRGSFSLVPIGARPFPNLTLLTYLLTYISMTKSTALARSRHKNASKDKLVGVMARPQKMCTHAPTFAKRDKLGNTSLGPLPRSGTELGQSSEIHISFTELANFPSLFQGNALDCGKLIQGLPCPEWNAVLFSRSDWTCNTTNWKGDNPLHYLLRGKCKQVFECVARAWSASGSD